MGSILAFYGAKGGVGTTTIAINVAIALHRELGRKVCLVDGNLQFGDHRVFLDLGLDRKSIVDVVTATSIDGDLIKSVLVKHDSGVDLLLAPPSPETAELVHPDHLPLISEFLRAQYDYVVIDIDKRLDDVNLGVFEAADTIFVVMTADLSCLKNVRLVLETVDHLGYPPSKVQLVLNRSNAFTGINVKNAEGALRRTIDHQIVNEYRGRDQRPELRRPVHVHEGRLGARRVAAALRADHRQAGHDHLDREGRHGPLNHGPPRGGEPPMSGR